MKINLHSTIVNNNIITFSTTQVKLVTCIILTFFLSLVSYIPAFSQKSVSAKKEVLAKKTISKCDSNDPAAQIKKAAEKTLKISTNNIWFEKNDGQFGGPDVLYGFRTPFGSMGVYGNKLRLVTGQTENGKKIGQQIVDITFPGASPSWAVVPGGKSEVKGSYNTKYGTINAHIYNELMLKNVYEGIDLRLYSGENGSLEFDWLVARAADHKKIRMNFTGQDGINIEKNGDIVIDLKHNDMRIVMPETYQVINGNKRLYATKMSKLKDKKTLQYEIAGNINPNLPLVIDPVMIWSTYMHNNTSTFDEYLYTIAVNTASEVYACGVTNEAISSAYMSGIAPGFSSTFTFGLDTAGDEQSVILYRLNPKGTAITAWTYTGQTTNIPVAMGIFPDNRILVVYQSDTIQIFSSDLTTRLYSDVVCPSAPITYQSQAIIDNDVFYLGGVAEAPLPTSIVPASAPDPVYAGLEGLILRIKTASSTPVPEWGTYVGGSSAESFTAIAATPDKTKLAFAVHVNGSGSGYPALVNAVDNTIAGTELLIGVIPIGKPTAFSMFSYLGGSGDEGKLSNKQNAALVAADNNYFYVAGNTTSLDIPGTAGSAQPGSSGGGSKSNQFVSQIPLNGSAGTGFISTYNGGNDVDIVGGLVIDSRTNDVLLFGTTQSNNFPVYNPSAYSPFFQSTHGNSASGKLDITYTVFANGLTTRKFATYIGGDHNDYLGSTGKLQGTGHFQYNPTNGFTYIGTTIHSDQTTIPSPWMSSIPGFDKSIPPATTNKDNHFIFAMSPSTDDFGDAPASYDAGTPASSAVSFFDIRIGDEVDAEDHVNSSLIANGDDTLNSGSLDDEDGILSIPSITAGDVSYSVTVSVFNNTGAAVNLSGWIDSDGNGVFDSYEYATATVPSSATQQSIVLNFSGLPPFFSSTGYSFLRVRIANVPLTATDATGALGKGEVEDYMVLQNLLLPISIEKFTAIPQAEKVLLNWKVSKEINVLNYTVQYSTDNIQFSNVNSTLASGNSNYSWLHNSPMVGSNYYRLKITATNGSVIYSSVQKVTFGNKANITVYPNPAENIINIGISGSRTNVPASICMFSIEGRLLSNKKINSLVSTETVDISSYPGGQYLLKIELGSEVIVKKITVVKHH